MEYSHQVSHRANNTTLLNYGTKSQYEKSTVQQIIKSTRTYKNYVSPTTPSSIKVNYLNTHIKIKNIFIFFTHTFRV